MQHAYLAIAQIPPASISRLNLYFPDPWPKKRHHRRRFVTPEHLAPLHGAMRPGAVLRIATDIPDYVRQTLEQVPRHGFEWLAERPADWREPWGDWISTRYEHKALREGRVQFADSYVLLKDNEAFLFGCQISPLPTVSTHVTPDPLRTRKLLLHRREIDRLTARVAMLMEREAMREADGTGGVIVGDEQTDGIHPLDRFGHKDTSIGICRVGNCHRLVDGHGYPRPFAWC